jgi:hypothetical protein
MANKVESVPGTDKPKGYQQITSLSSATELTVPDGSRYALIQADTQNVRWRDDGTAPTGSVGMPLVKDTLFTYAGDLKAIQFIEQAASATLNVTYFG